MKDRLANFVSVLGGVLVEFKKETLPVQDLSGKTVMVAGGAGFVGSAVVRELLKWGSAVVCFDNYLHGHPSHVSGIVGPLEIIYGDVRDDWTLYKAIRANS